MPSKSPFGDPFRFTRKFLALAGTPVLSESISPLKRQLLIFYSTYALVNCQIFLVQEIMQLRKSYHQNMTFFIENFGMAIAHVLTSLKVLHFFRERKKIVSVMKILSYKEMFVEAGDFDPQKIFLESQKSIFQANVTYFSILMLTPFFNYTSALIQMLSTPEDAFEESDETCERLLPFYSWFMFKLNNRKNCLLALFYQFVPVLIYGFQIFGIDALIMAIEHELATHFNLLQGAFRTVTFKKPTEQLPNTRMVKNRKKMQSEEYNFLSHLIHYTKHLQTTIQLTIDAEALFTFINLGAVLTSLMIVVSNFFTLSQAQLLSSTFFRQIIYMGAMIYQLGIYTSYGNEITLKSGNVLQGIYFSDWVPRSLEFKRNMLFNMTRLQKPLYFTIGKFSPLTLATFVSIIRAAYSCFAVLKSTTN